MIERRDVARLRRICLSVAALAMTASNAMAADKGKVKDIGEGGNGIFTGTLVDDQTGELVPFAQPFLDELGIGIGSGVRYTPVLVDGKTTVALLLQPSRAEVRFNPKEYSIEKARIVEILDDQSGIVELKSGKRFPFIQPYLQALVPSGENYVVDVLKRTGGFPEGNVILVDIKKPAR